MENVIEEPQETGEETPEETGEEEVQEEEVQEKEPTIKELMDLVKAQGTLIEKANKRTQYLQRKLTRGSTPEKMEPPKEKPNEDTFDTHAEYVEALTDWKVQQHEHSRAEQMTERQKKEREEDFFSVIDSGTDVYPDFNEVARKPPEDGGPTINGHMLEAMMDSDCPVDIAYHLGQNVQESARIASLSPISAAKEIGKIEAIYAGGNKPIPQRTKTKTVTPSKPIQGKTKTETDLSDMSTKDFIAQRNRQFGVE